MCLIATGLIVISSVFNMICIKKCSRPVQWRIWYYYIAIKNFKFQRTEEAKYTDRSGRKKKKKNKKNIGK